MKANCILWSATALAACAGFCWGQTQAQQPSASPYAPAVPAAAVQVTPPPAQPAVIPVLPPPAQPAVVPEMPPPPPAAVAPEMPPPVQPAPLTDPAAVTIEPGAANACGRFWASADYLLWWVKKAPESVPLVTSDPNGGSTNTAGGLADPTTTLVLGGHGFDLGTFSGGRVNVGYACADGVGFEAGGFLLARQTKTVSVHSDANGNPFLFRPVFDVDTGNPNAGLIVSLPTSTAPLFGFTSGDPGSVFVTNTSELWGADTVVSSPLVATEAFRLTGLVGLRYLELHETLQIGQETTDFAPIGNFGGPPTLPGDQLRFLDNFGTRNQFYGGQVGVRAEAVLWQRLVFSLDGRVSVGATDQTTDVAGYTSDTSAGVTLTRNGGLLALPSNSGSFHHSSFSVVPEAMFQVSFDLNACVRLSAGYDVLYWNKVVRPGNQIVPVISFGQAPVSPTYGTFSPPQVPLPPHKTSDFWAEGVHFGVDFRF